MFKKLTETERAYLEDLEDLKATLKPSREECETWIQTCVGMASEYDQRMYNQTMEYLMEDK